MENKTKSPELKNRTVYEDVLKRIIYNHFTYSNSDREIELINYLKKVNALAN